jgi:hypothetical protein
LRSLSRSSSNPFRLCPLQRAGEPVVVVVERDR